MRNAKKRHAHQTMPEARQEDNPYPAIQHQSDMIAEDVIAADVIAEGWSAEHIAEESVYLDITEVKEEMIEGKWVMRINRSARIFSPPSFDHRR
jgi:hypothetical protein